MITIMFWFFFQEKPKFHMHLFHYLPMNTSKPYKLSWQLKRYLSVKLNLNHRTFERHLLSVGGEAVK